MTLSSAPSSQVNEVKEHYNKLKDALIMMVDDEPIMMDLVQTFLESEGYKHFVNLEDSTQAVSEVLQQRPDVLLLDLNMPEVNGFEILAELQQDDKLNHIPVIVLTSSSDSDSKLKALELGATDFLAKPVDPSELALRLRNTLTVKAYQDQLAYYDALTGLPNRKLFLDRLEWSLSRQQREGGSAAIIDISLDGFKKINQSLGIKSGDILLKCVADRLMEHIRQSDVVSKIPEQDLYRSLSRLAGDEFSILLTDIDRPDQVETIIRRLVNLFQTPFNIANEEVLISASVGVAIYPDDGDTSDSLVKRAGVASAHVKQNGGNGYHFFSKELEARSKQRLSLEMDLRQAIEHQEFALHYQPKVWTATQQIMGMEALLRWQHPKKGMISPAEFIPLAEELGLLPSIGRWVIIEGCRQLARWQQQGLPPLKLSINVSPQQLKDKSIITLLGKAIEKFSLSPSQLVIEITESLAMEDSTANVELLHAIKALGVDLSIDDFGTGYSSLSYLKHLPFDELKIDRSFLINIPNDRDEVAIVKAIIAMAQSLDLRVVAEGVEEAPQLEFLNKLQCEVIQGFYFSKPLPSKAFAEFVLSHKQ
ncbi:hypothetical protein R50073_25700 [Maricurvus nonylphenolicus]|uniref:GGDEF/EAL domain-containing response regulator n=1 Tax=Maricurvus nonylphenolicus TaxID=1008307 RepID=UPI0036F2B046